MLTAEATTILLRDMRRGQGSAREALFEGVYAELRAVAGALLRGREGGQTLQPTALVHEAWLKLGSASELTVHDRAHFMAVAATAMRQILVDHARARSAAKRGGGARRVPLEALDTPDRATAPEEVLAMDECLQRLEALEPRQARVVEMRVFAGMTVPEAADALGVSTRTVELDWRMARAWLGRELSHAGS
jgi:RNA polymerase sigma factor (TIGR02999 family)